MAAFNIRLSRISYPRANVWVLLSLVIILLGFGLWAEAAMPVSSESAELIPQIGSAALDGNWGSKLHALL